MTKKKKFQQLFSKGTLDDEILFRPILMHFAARYIGKSYKEFASDYKTLVESNLRCLEDFDLDAVGLISDPYRETSAFGAKITFPDEAVPRCEELIIKTLDHLCLQRAVIAACYEAGGLSLGIEMARQDRLASRSDQRAREDGLELAHVARPASFPKRLESLRRAARLGEPGPPGETRSEMPDQRRDVVRPVPQRGNPKLHHGQAIVQVLPEPALSDQRGEILVGRRDDADIE